MFKKVKHGNRMPHAAGTYAMATNKKGERRKQRKSQGRKEKC